MSSNKKWLGLGHYKLTDKIVKRLWPNFPFYRNKLLIPRNWTDAIKGTGGNGNFILWVNNGSSFYGPITLSNYLNQWVHFAIVRQSGTSSVYKNGSRILNISTPNDVTNLSDQLQIGYGSGNYWNGKITNFRWVKGSSVYDGTQTTITVPTAPLDVISGTKLLLLANTAETYITDSSDLNKSATNNGSVMWSSDSPFTC